jgi:hypothetical protein
MLLTPQEQLKLNLTAFFFNSRADALRGEMYRALCLYVLSNSKSPLSADEVVESIILSLGANNSTFRSLKVVVTEELHTLVKKGDVQLLENGTYKIEESTVVTIHDSSDIKMLDEKIKEEIRQIAKTLNPTLSKSQLDTLNQFFLEASNLIASRQVPFLTRGEAIHVNTLDDQELAALVSECRIKFGIDGFIDSDRFLQKVFISPPENLSRYLYCLYQISVTIQLLAWDPSLEYIEKNVLANLKLYIDTNIIFVLMQETNPGHQFVLSLLQASIDLGVVCFVQTTTLREYQSVIEWADEQFDGYQQTLREIMSICKRDGDDPARYIEGSLFIDFVLKNPLHIDSGSWHKYLTSVSLAALQKKLKALSIQIDESSLSVPQQEYESIKTSMLRASKEQSERKNRNEVKRDTGHDARLFYRVKNSRKKRPEGELSLGYDTYLLTFDGSLIFFLKDYGIPWTETYFVFPDQWYELSFPFFRIKFSNQKEFAAAVTTLVFSPAFPSLSYLMPLELCKYIFELGGSGLPMGSLQQVIREGVENRFMANVDPASKDKRKREENELQIKRMIAQEKIKHEDVLKPIYDEARKAQDQTLELKTEVRNLSEQKEELSKIIQQQLVYLETTKTHVDAAQAQQTSTIRTNYENQLADIEKKSREQVEKLEKEIERRDRRIADLQTDLGNMQVQLKQILENQRLETEARKAESDRQKKEADELLRKQRASRFRVRKIVVSIFMIIGLVGSLALLLGLKFETLWILFTIAALSIGLLVYLLSGLWALIPYGIGLIIVTSVILDRYKLNALLWIIPAVWELIVFTIEKILKKDN